MLGKWSNEHIVKSYVNGIPLNAVLARAGFQNAVHVIPRSTVEAPQLLLDLIFPGIEEMLEDKKQVCYDRQRAKLLLGELCLLPPTLSSATQQFLLFIACIASDPHARM